MDAAPTLQTLQDIFRDVLEDDTLVIDAGFSAATCPQWDSVATVQIVLAVESAFGTRFSTDEVARLRSVADILKKIQPD